MTISTHPRVALVHAIGRIEQQLQKAESELPELAAPDGTVAIQIDDLRALMIDYDAMMMTLATGKQHWAVCHYGSEPLKGDHIHTVTEHGSYKEMLAYLGDGPNAHEAAGKIVAAHNAALNDLTSAVQS